MPDNNPDFVLSLARGLSVIEAFQNRLDGATVGEVAALTNLSRAAVRRSLLTLELLGYTTHSGPAYRLTPRILRLGFAFLSSNSLATLAQPVLEQVTAAIQESSSLSTLDGDEIVYIARSATRRVMAVGLAVGSRLPAYCTSMGRVLLAALPEAEFSRYLEAMEIRPHTAKAIANKCAFAEEIRRVRHTDFALVDEELELGLRSIAVPVRARSGKVVAAMNTGVQAARVSADELFHRCLPTLRKSALELGQSLA